MKEDAKKTIEQFDALKEVHRRLEDAKKQETALEKLPEHKDNYTKAVDNSALYEQTQKFTDIFADNRIAFFGQYLHKITLWNNNFDVFKLLYMLSNIRKF